MKFHLALSAFALLASNVHALPLDASIRNALVTRDPGNHRPVRRFLVPRGDSPPPPEGEKPLASTPENGPSPPEKEAGDGPKDDRAGKQPAEGGKGGQGPDQKPPGKSTPDESAESDNASAAEGDLPDRSNQKLVMDDKDGLHYVDKDDPAWQVQKSVASETAVKPKDPWDISDKFVHIWTMKDPNVPDYTDDDGQKQKGFKPGKGNDNKELNEWYGNKLRGAGVYVMSNLIDRLPTVYSQTWKEEDLEKVMEKNNAEGAETQISLDFYNEELQDLERKYEGYTTLSEHDVGMAAEEVNTKHNKKFDVGEYNEQTFADEFLKKLDLKQPEEGSGDKTEEKADASGEKAAGAKDKPAASEKEPGAGGEKKPDAAPEPEAKGDAGKETA